MARARSPHGPPNGDARPPGQKVLAGGGQTRRTAWQFPAQWPHPPADKATSPVAFSQRNAGHGRSETTGKPACRKSNNLLGRLNRKLSTVGRSVTIHVGRRGAPPKLIVGHPFVDVDPIRHPEAFSQRTRLGMFRSSPNQGKVELGVDHGPDGVQDSRSRSMNAPASAACRPPATPVRPSASAGPIEPFRNVGHDSTVGPSAA